MIEGIVTSAFTGGLTGLAGMIFQGIAAGRARQKEREHELKARALDQAEMRLEAKLAIAQTRAETTGKTQVATVEADAATEVAAAGTQQASYGHDKARYGGGFVDSIRGLMRPLITVALLVIQVAISWHLYQLVQSNSGTFDIPRIQDLLEEVVLATIYLATTAITWWFGSRPQRQSSR